MSEIHARIESGSHDLIVMSSAANMPSSCKGEYRRVALLRVERGVVPAMISARARGVVELLGVAERLNVGSTDRCAFRRVVLQSTEQAHDLAMEEASLSCATA